MTAWGYMLREHVENAGAGLLAAIDQHPTTAPPDLMPVWAWWSTVDRAFRVDWRLLEAIRAVGMTPIVYAEASLDPTAILRGDHDDALALLAARSRGALIRWLHEPNGRGLFSWQTWTEEAYREVWIRSARIFRAEGAGIAYCVVARGRRAEADMFRHWPGAAWVDAVGFDEFRRSADEPPPAQRWAVPIDAFATRAPGVPCYVFEAGVDAALTGRGREVRGWGEVRGLAGVCAFDMRIIVPSPPAAVPIDDDWTWGSAMVREWDRLPR